MGRALPIFQFHEIIAFTSVDGTRTANKDQTIIAVVALKYISGAPKEKK